MLTDAWLFSTTLTEVAPGQLIAMNFGDAGDVQYGMRVTAIGDDGQPLFANFSGGGLVQTILRQITVAKLADTRLSLSPADIVSPMPGKSAQFGQIELIGSAPYMRATVKGDRHHGGWVDLAAGVYSISRPSGASLVFRRWTLVRGPWPSVVIHEGCFE